jgi:SAM-dependent methyltransferase
MAPMGVAQEGDPPPRWRRDEIASAGRENLDPGHVARYDQKEDAGAAAEVELLGRWGLVPGAAAVDLGAGTGQFALAAAGVCSRVVAVDVSPAMAAHLRARVAAAGAASVEVVQAGFLSYEHRGAPVDVVYTRWALHHLPDFWKVLALQRVRSILRPGGVLRLADIVYSFAPGDAEAGIERWRTSFPEVGGEGEWTRADIDEHVRDEHSTFTWLLEPMIESSGFRIEHADRSADGILAAYVARAV